MAKESPKKIKKRRRYNYSATKARVKVVDRRSSFRTSVADCLNVNGEVSGKPKEEEEYDTSSELCYSFDSASSFSSQGSILFGDNYCSNDEGDSNTHKVKYKKLKSLSHHTTPLSNEDYSCLEDKMNTGKSVVNHPLVNGASESKGISDVRVSADYRTNVALTSNTTNANRGDHNNPVNRQMIYRIALTGGACGGKSSVITKLQNEGTNKLGFRIYCVPEAATLMTSGGLRWSDDPVETMKYQLALLRTQIALEDQFYAIAKASGKPSIIVSDRGTMDGRAYCSEEQFNNVLAEGGWEMHNLSNDRYDAVAHLISTACDAPEFYNFDNPSRYETVEQACATDKKLRKMYVGHPKVRLFDNSTDFEKKVSRVIQFIIDVARNDYPTNRTHRLYIRVPPLESDLPDDVGRVMVTNTILSHSTPESVAMVMKRCQGMVSSHYYITVRREGKQRLRSVHRVSLRCYLRLLNQRDHNRVDVVKKSYSFVAEDLYCELCIFEEPVWAKGKGIMYVESNVGCHHHGLESDSVVEVVGDVESVPEKIKGVANEVAITATECAPLCSLTSTINAELIKKLPTFIKVERDITDKKFLSSFYLSLKDRGHEYAEYCTDDKRVSKL